MKNKILNRIFSLATVFGLAFGIATSLNTKVLASETVEDYKAKPDEYYSYVQNFTDLSAVNNAFNAYYLQNELGSGKLESVSDSASAVDAHWCIEGGVLKRINDVKPSETTNRYETNQLAVLTFTKEAYLNFELSVDYKRGANGFWPVVAIRQLEEGKYYLDDGAGVFVQQNGTITLWGDADVSGPYEFASIDGYNASIWHNMQIKVLGNTLSVSIDNAPWVNQSLPEEFYEAGYVSLVSTNNESEFKNFRIKALAEPVVESNGTFVPKQEATTDDALSNLAGEVKPGTPDEREGKVNPDLVYTEIVEVEVTVPQKSGCSGSVGSSSVMALLAIGSLISLAKRR